MFARVRSLVGCVSVWIVHVVGWWLSVGGGHMAVSTRHATSHVLFHMARRLKLGEATWITESVFRGQGSVDLSQKLSSDAKHKWWQRAVMNLGERIEFLSNRTRINLPFSHTGLCTLHYTPYWDGYNIGPPLTSIYDVRGHQHHQRVWTPYSVYSVFEIFFIYHHKRAHIDLSWVILGHSMFHPPHQPRQQLVYRYIFIAMIEKLRGQR